MQAVVAVAAAFALIGVGAAAAKPATSGHMADGGWGPGVEAVVPANAAAVRDDVVIESVSCPSVGNCTAVGDYTDNSRIQQGLLLTETAGSWGVGVEAVLPANARNTPAVLNGAFIRSVSCASAGNCSAVGTYYDAAGNQEGVLLTETAGSWAAGVEAVLPANAATSVQLVQWGSVSCASAGNCTAVGMYTAAGSTTAFRGLMVNETDGNWSAGIEAVTPVPDASAWLNSVSCASAGNCTAVGGDFYGGELGRGLLVTETDGSWAPGTEATLPGDGTGGAELTSVSCASAGNCTAVGSYNGEIVSVGRDRSEERAKGLVLTETAGTWGTGVELVMPADADGSDPLDPLDPLRVSCSSAGNCSAVGSYYVGTFEEHGVLLTETAGSWADGVEALPVAGAANNAVSCTSPGNCAAGVIGGLVTETANKWGAAVAPPLPANGVAGTYVYSVSCPPTGACVAVGSYYDGSSRQGGLLIGGSPPSVMLTVATSGTGSGAVASAPAGIDCGSTCSTSVDAGSTVTLIALPAAGSRFSGWSDHGCPGVGSCQVNTGLSEQTVTATFDLLLKCTVPELKGKLLRTAERAIRIRHCAVGTITRATSRTIKTGRVISQKPEAGRRLQPGGSVSLVVSSGKRKG